MTAFPSTRWSLIQASERPPGEIAAAWSELVRDYRPAIVAFFRRATMADAEDLTQEFLLRSMRENWWSRADAAVGSFRRFLFVLLTRFLGQQRRLAFRRLETSAATIESEHDDTPDKQFDVDFATCLARSALDRLRADYARDGRETVFDVLQEWLSEAPPHGELARLGAALGIAPNTLAVQLKRLRLRFRKMTLETLEQLSSDTVNAEREAGALRHALQDTTA
jgi:DNA-directed RNA polymerase specialized sigma24 family protein